MVGAIPSASGSFASIGLGPEVKKNVEKGIAKSLVYQNPAELEELRARFPTRSPARFNGVEHNIARRVVMYNDRRGPD